MEIDEAWNLVTGSPHGLSVEDRRLRANLQRRLRERRTPFLPNVVSDYEDHAMERFIDGLLQGTKGKIHEKPEAMNDG